MSSKTVHLTGQCVHIKSH